MRQHTLRKAVSLEGVGLHSGKTVRVTLSPGPADSGIVFRVGDDGEPIPAAPESVVDSHYATTIGKNGARGDRHAVVAQDRKSTRLNSSHTVISYAVFCLKKKKTEISTTAQT